MELSRKTIEDCLFVLRHERNKQENRYFSIFAILKSEKLRKNIFNFIVGLSKAIAELEAALKEMDVRKLA